MKYEVTGRVPKLGKVKHVIRAQDAEVAKALFERAHPKAANKLSVKELKG